MVVRLPVTRTLRFSLRPVEVGFGRGQARRRAEAEVYSVGCHLYLPSDGQVLFTAMYRLVIQNNLKV